MITPLPRNFLYQLVKGVRNSTLNIIKVKKTFYFDSTFGKREFSIPFTYRVILSVPLKSMVVFSFSERRLFTSFSRLTSKVLVLILCKRMFTFYQMNVPGNILKIEPSLFADSTIHSQGFVYCGEVYYA